MICVYSLFMLDIVFVYVLLKLIKYLMLFYNLFFKHYRGIVYDTLLYNEYQSYKITSDLGHKYKL